MLLKLITGIALLGLIAPVGADTYELDTSHAAVSFSVRHLGLSKVKGEFKEYEAAISYDGAPESLSLEMTIQAASIDTRNEDRDEHLQNKDFFEVETYPTIHFKSTSVKTVGDQSVLVGDLTMKGVTKSVEFPIEISGPIDSPFQKGVKLIGINFEGSIARHDFNVAPDGMSDKAIGSDVSFDVSLEAKK